MIDDMSGRARLSQPELGGPHSSGAMPYLRVYLRAEKSRDIFGSGNRSYLRSFSNSRDELLGPFLIPYRSRRREKDSGDNDTCSPARASPGKFR